MISQLTCPAVAYVILLLVLQQSHLPESQICNSVGPCSGHRILHISEINSDQGQISKKYVILNISENEFPHNFFGICNLNLRQQKAQKFVEISRQNSGQKSKNRGTSVLQLF